MPTAPVIETQALTKVFGAQRALDGVNLTVAPGAIGLLGPNGAGKSTFMKCLLQLQPITSGSAKLLGREFFREVEDEDGEFRSGRESIANAADFKTPANLAIPKSDGHKG